jgi:hypothetical protein
MVKLIKLQGDSDKSDTQIRNIFNSGIIIPPNSKVGLRSCRVNFLNIQDFENYTLPADTVIELDWHVGTIPPNFVQEIEVPSQANGKPIDYESTTQLLNAIQKASNSTWSGGLASRTIYEGYHTLFALQDSKTAFYTYSLPTIKMAFAAQNNQFARLSPDTAADMTLGNGSIEVSATTALPLGADVELQGLLAIPLVNTVLSGVLEVLPANDPADGDDCFKFLAQKDTAHNALWGWGISKNSLGDRRYAFVILSGFVDIPRPIQALATDGVATAPTTVNLISEGGGVTVSELGGVNPTVRVRTQTAHGLAVGDTFTMSGVTASFVGEGVISAIPIANFNGPTFTVSVEDSPTELHYVMTGSTANTDGDSSSLGGKVITNNSNQDPLTLTFSSATLDAQVVKWSVLSDRACGYKVSNLTYQASGNMGNATADGLTINTTLQLPRNTKLGKSNPLGSYLGFVDTIYTDSGSPSIIKSDQPSIGRNAYPAILVQSLSGLDLDSYAGKQDAPNKPISFFDVIVPQSVEAISNMIYEPNNIAMLDLHNARPIELSDMQIQFARDDTGQPLKFFGQPTVVLELQDGSE